MLGRRLYDRPADVMWYANHDEVKILGLEHLTIVGIALYSMLVLLPTNDFRILIADRYQIRAVRSVQARNVVFECLLTQADDARTKLHTTLPIDIDWKPRRFEFKPHVKRNLRSMNPETGPQLSQ
ncbi:hypothetical protein FRACA_1920016 [Frankia canadensis]|uniref:Uncharacterized protein n=1 Tax=Frankia canadensis TaxID=1836972 RepID=A0A2I2KPF3_9ACTN|nr:hypothetical protein FRACA_1920016 [Frankia canadensis]SOU54809.1 hypothetical protein FRACA_1920016 [Frankia canadensis]